MYLRNLIFKIAIISFIVITLVYSGLKLKPILSGPEITIYSPQNGDDVASTTFMISGRVLRAKEIKIFDRVITVNEKGEFEERLVSFAPYTIIKISATDRFGRSDEKELFVIPK
jgi:hypothetical protein